MSSAFRLTAAAALALLCASPCWALSEVKATQGPDGAAKLADPDEALSGLYKYFADPSGPQARPDVQARGPMKTYDLSTTKTSEAHDGYDLLRAHPSDPSLNPFMSTSSEASK